MGASQPLAESLRNFNFSLLKMVTPHPTPCWNFPPKETALGVVLTQGSTSESWVGLFTKFSYSCLVVTLEVLTQYL